MQQKKKVAEERRLYRGDHKNTDAYMKMLYAELLRMKIESRYTREIASLAEQEEYIGKKRLHQVNEYIDLCLSICLSACQAFKCSKYVKRKGKAASGK